MKKQSKYNKSASYEAKIGEVDEVLLLYSGGLDTSVILKWIQDEYKAKVTTLTLDLGQQKDDLELVKQKALSLGAVEAIVLDVKNEFADFVISKAIKANASYQGDYHLSTPLGRVVAAAKAVDTAHEKGIFCIAHGCTGKGNDQVRFDGYVLAMDPTMKIIAPVREWDMDRTEEISYALKNGIDVPVKKDFPYSVDDNMWGMTWEGGEIENPASIPQIEKFLTTHCLPEDAPNKAEIVTISFEAGIPVSLNGKQMSLAHLIESLNKIGGTHGVGIVYMIEDRIVGLKDRGVYEQPAAQIIIEAHKALERYVSTRELNEIKTTLDTKWAYLCYGAKWYDPTVNAIDAFNDEVNQKVYGEVTVKLYKGTVTVIALDSPYGLQHASFNNKEGYKFNVGASAGFTEIYTLQMRIANEIDKKKK